MFEMLQSYGREVTAIYIEDVSAESLAQNDPLPLLTVSRLLRAAFNRIAPTDTA